MLIRNLHEPSSVEQSYVSNLPAEMFQILRLDPHFVCFVMFCFTPNHINSYYMGDMVGYRFHHHPKKMHKLSKDCFKGKSGSPNASLLLGLFPGVGPRCARARGREALPPAGEVLGARRLARGRIGDRNWGFSRFSPMVFPELEVQPPESAKTSD